SIAEPILVYQAMLFTTLPFISNLILYVTHDKTLRPIGWKCLLKADNDPNPTGSLPPADLFVMVKHKSGPLSRVYFELEIKERGTGDCVDWSKCW
ncbi:hypothetical protein N9B43_06255, partial [Mariniblastus sp.]|nr:hypothetical protein [Mariniblastus sp.]